MPRKSTKEICCQPETKRRIKAVKPEGVTFDRWLRDDPRLRGDDRDV